MPNANPPAGPPPGAATSRGAPRTRRRRGDVQPFDFRRPTKFSREHARVLQVVNETFARQFATVLTTTLRAASQVTLGTIDQVAYDEYARALPEPAYLALLSLEPLSGVGILQLPIDVAMGAVDRLLGGNGNGPQPQRPVSQIEASLLAELTERVLQELAYAYETLTELRPALVQVESSLQFAQVAAASDPMIVLTYDVRIGDTAGVATLCLPFAALHPVLDTASTSTLLAERTGTDPVAFSSRLEHRLTDAPVGVAVRFRPVALTSAEILALRPGDVLPLHHAVTAPLSVEADGVPLAAAMPGSAGKRLACLIVEPDQPSGTQR